MLNKSLLGGDLEDIVDLELPKALDVDGTTLLIGLVIEVRVNSLDLVVLLEVEDLQSWKISYVSYIEKQ